MKNLLPCSYMKISGKEQLRTANLLYVVLYLFAVLLDVKLAYVSQNTPTSGNVPQFYQLGS